MAAAVGIPCSIFDIFSRRMARLLFSNSQSQNSLHSGSSTGSGGETPKGPAIPAQVPDAIESRRR
jgi:hypothetical protein